jgi:hypothetical protein
MVAWVGVKVGINKELLAISIASEWISGTGK